MILPAELAGEGLMRAVCRWTGSVVRCGVALCISSQVQDRVVGWVEPPVAASQQQWARSVQHSELGL
jgi:hypothetical protein